MKAREGFEALPEIIKRVNALEFNDYTKEYESSLMFCSNEAYVNGALMAFQEQQKIINMQECSANQIIEILNNFESSEKPASFYLRKIKELLK